jgi:hypothetical protein
LQIFKTHSFAQTQASSPEEAKKQKTEHI